MDNRLFDYDWMECRVADTDIDTLIADYRRATNDTDAETIAAALDLSAHILRDDPSQLWSQLQSRTMTYSSRRVERLIAHRPKTLHWRCLHPTFAQAEGPLIRTLYGHVAPVHAVALSADGETVVSASADKALRVWDLVTGQSKLTIRGDAFFQRCVVTPDGRTLVAGDDRGAVHFFQLVGS